MLTSFEGCELLAEMSGSKSLLYFQLCSLVSLSLLTIEVGVLIKSKERNLREFALELDSSQAQKLLKLARLQLEPNLNKIKNKLSSRFLMCLPLEFKLALTLKL